jgi:hypothetical protein
VSRSGGSSFCFGLRLRIYRLLAHALPPLQLTRTYLLHYTGIPVFALRCYLPPRADDRSVSLMRFRFSVFRWREKGPVSYRLGAQSGDALVLTLPQTLFAWPQRRHRDLLSSALALSRCEPTRGPSFIFSVSKSASIRQKAPRIRSVPPQASGPGSDGYYSYGCWRSRYQFFARNPESLRAFTSSITCSEPKIDSFTAPRLAGFLSPPRAERPILESPRLARNAVACGQNLERLSRGRFAANARLCSALAERSIAN